MATRQLDLIAGGAKPSDERAEAVDAAESVRSGAARRRWARRNAAAAGGGGDDAPTPPADASLALEAQRRYLNYAVSVITSRALPDVRDGLKPVQRRILYAMYANLHLYPDAKFRKSATIVGDVLGKFHPHGDTACYDAMVRLAQPFSMRVHAGRGARQLRLARRRRAGRAPLHRGAPGAAGDGAARRDQAGDGRLPPQLRRHDRGADRAAGQGAAAARQRLHRASPSAWRPTSRRTTWPRSARPPSRCIDDPKLETKDLLKYIKGPDFPTGGQITNSKKELREIYETGQGGVRVRGEWKTESGGQAAATTSSSPRSRTRSPRRASSSGSPT